MENPENPSLDVQAIVFGNKLFFIAGPCVVETEEILMTTAERLKNISTELDLPFIFKSSYRKANRSSLNSFTGIGDHKALKLLNKVREQFEVPVITDIHSVAEAELAANFVDVLQIPAFLCRQTDLLQAAAKTNKVVGIKKGQFMSPESMLFALDKVRQSGNDKVFLIERGTSFGYQDLVVDFRSIAVMQNFDSPVVMDCTHSIQKPNQNSGTTGGTPEHIESIAKAAIAVGANGIFVETHPDPGSALSDGANMLHLDHLKPLLQKLIKIKNALD